jgi:hypothetical protein
MPRGPKWTADEDDAVRRLYPTARCSQIEHALPGRTYAAIQKRAETLGVSRRTWTDGEVKTLRRLYATASEKRLHDAFPGRSRQSIWNKAHALGLKRKRDNPTRDWAWLIKNKSQT